MSLIPKIFKNIYCYIKISIICRQPNWRFACTVSITFFLQSISLQFIDNTNISYLLVEDKQLHPPFSWVYFIAASNCCPHSHFLEWKNFSSNAFGMKPNIYRFRKICIFCNQSHLRHPVVIIFRKSNHSGSFQIW